MDRKLDLILTRLGRIEQRLERSSNGNAADACLSKTPLEPQSLASQTQALGIVKLNQQTGCFEYYGISDRFMLVNEAYLEEVKHPRSRSLPHLESDLIQAMLEQDW